MADLCTGQTGQCGEEWIGAPGSKGESTKHCICCADDIVRISDCLTEGDDLLMVYYATGPS